MKSTLRRSYLFYISAAAAAVAAAGILWWSWPAGSAARYAAITSATATATALTVSVVEPTRQDWPRVVQADGSLAAWQEAVVGAETGSLRIAALYADVGSVVKRGQLLALLAQDTAEANASKQEALAAKARVNLGQAQANLRRTRMAADSGALSGQKIDESESAEVTARSELKSAEADLRTARITLAHTRIVAVDDGVVSSRTALLGNVVPAGTELFRLMRQGRIEWHAEVDARQLAQVRPGQHARVSLPGGQQIDGEVRLIAPTLSTSTGRAIVYVALPAQSGVQSGVFASGVIEGAVASALTLPESALVQRDGRTDVYVLNADGKTVSRRTVTVARRRNDRVEIVAGLDANARVVASGGAFLADGAAVRVATRVGAVVRGVL